MKLSLGRKERLSFSGLKMDDDSAARIVRRAYALRELDMCSLCLSVSLSLITKQMIDGGLLAIC